MNISRNQTFFLLAETIFLFTETIFEILYNANLDTLNRNNNSPKRYSCWLLSHIICNNIFLYNVTQFDQLLNIYEKFIIFINYCFHLLIKMHLFFLRRKKLIFLLSKPVFWDFWKSAKTSGDCGGLMPNGQKWINSSIFIDSQRSPAVFSSI